MKMTKTKAVVAAIGTAVTVLTAALADDVFNASEMGTFIATLIEGGTTVWAVWRVQNKPAAAPAQYR